MADRGVDGLTAEELRRGRKAFWDDAFTQAFVRALPPGARRVLEIGCGVGQLVAELTRVDPDLVLIGLDIDPGRTSAAREALRVAGRADRASFVTGRGEALPVAAGSLDAVLTSMALMHVSDPAVVLAAAARALRAGGVLICAEPDNLSQRWYFDGLCEEVTAAFAALFAESWRRRRPADLAIGPRVATLLRAAGFVDVAVRVHASFTSQHETAADCAARWRRVLGTLAGAVALPDDHPLVSACTRALDAFVAAGPPDRQGQGGETVPIFVTAGTRTRSASS